MFEKKSTQKNIWLNDYNSDNKQKKNVYKYGSDIKKWENINTHTKQTQNESEFRP